MQSHGVFSGAEFGKSGNCRLREGQAGRDGIQVRRRYLQISFRNSNVLIKELSQQFQKEGLRIHIYETKEALGREAAL